MNWQNLELWQVGIGCDPPVYNRPGPQTRSFMYAIPVRCVISQ